MVQGGAGPERRSGGKRSGVGGHRRGGPPDTKQCVGVQCLSDVSYITKLRETTRIGLPTLVSHSKVLVAAP